MVIDSHEHIMFPTKMQLDKIDAAGVDKTILFCTAPHPEKAVTLNELEAEMVALNKILAGSNTKTDNISRLKKNGLIHRLLSIHCMELGNSLLVMNNRLCSWKQFSGR